MRGNALPHCRWRQEQRVLPRLSKKCYKLPFLNISLSGIKNLFEKTGPAMPFMFSPAPGIQKSVLLIPRNPGGSHKTDTLTFIFLRQAVHRQTDVTGKEMSFDAVLPPEISKSSFIFPRFLWI